VKNQEIIREVVRRKYAQAITAKTGCCGSSGCCGTSDGDATKIVTGNLYGANQVEGLPQEMLQTSLGCGNPTALGKLYAGEVVLDLGSGAGLDVLLSARRVGPNGKAFGLDMTDEMLETANSNKEKSGIVNAEFLKGHIEEIPLPDNSVDVVISNCVINLSADKDQVFREIYRVLRPGGRVAVSDIVTTKVLPEKIRKGLMAWAGCVAGALTVEEYQTKLANAGFEKVEIVPTRIYDLTGETAKPLIPEATLDEMREINGTIMSSFIRAKKPAVYLTPGKDFDIRFANAMEFTAIQHLLKVSGLPTEGVEPGQGSFLVAVKDGLLGVIGIEYYGKAVLLRSFAVEPKVRKAGIAKALVEKAFREMKDAGAADVYLLTNTAVHYFESYGFTVIEREEIPENILNQSSLGVVCSLASTCMHLKLS